MSLYCYIPGLLRDLPSSVWLRATRGDGEERPEPVGENIWRLADESWAMLGQAVDLVMVYWVQQTKHAG